MRELEGSLAIGAQAAADPRRLFFSLRGSGQALYVGLAEDAYVVTSEPYGLIEETQHYLRLDGETPADAERASATRGQVVTIDVDHAGTVEGIGRTAFDGSALRVRADELVDAEITTRDIDRGDYPHFLLKEISEAPASFRTTLRGRIVEHDGMLAVALGTDTLPDSTPPPGARRLDHPRGRRSARGRPRWRRRARRPRSSDWSGHGCGPMRWPRPSSPGSSSPTTCRTRSSSRSARAAPPPTPTAPSTLRGAGAHR